MLPTRISRTLSGIAAVLAFPSVAGAATFWPLSLSDTVDSSPGDGACVDAWGQCTLRAAVIEANALGGPDEIRLPAGTFTFTLGGPDEDQAYTGDLDVREDLTVLGLGPGITILDANFLDRIFHGISAVDLTVKDLTVKNGWAESAMYTPTYGGAIWMYDYPAAGNLTLDNTLFEGNTVYDTGNAWGGAIATTGGGMLTITDSEFYYNAATGSTNDLGGAIKGGYYTTTVLDNCWITANSADIGGGVSLNGDSEIYDTTISANAATADGGGIQFYYFDHFMVGSSVYDNTASVVGGGLAVIAANLLFENATLSGNIAWKAGGAYVNNGWLGLIHATIANNRSTGDLTTGGVWLNASTGESTNSILARNNGVNRPDCKGTFTSHGHNLLGVYNNMAGSVCNGFSAPGDQVGTYGVPINPRLGSLGNYGGPTVTHSLRRSSPAIDQGDNFLSLGDDQRGVLRPRDGNGDGVAVCDIGAFEL